ncbi:MAG: PQQ-like beta-propeller repeat protein, partial [Actinobacteria bacterium]|nr:PQQ-like beta-propeller repeat protein [Actinomycetota bacterium]
MKRLFSIIVCAVMAVPFWAVPAHASDWPTDGGPDGTGFIQAPRFKTHSLRWSTKMSDLPSGIYPMSPLLVSAGRVIVNGAGTDSVLGLDVATGEVVWRFQPDPRHSGAFGGYPNANQPYISNGIYYTTANNGFLYALDVKTGKKIWSFQVTGTDYNKTIDRVAVCGGRVFLDTLGGIPAQGQKNIFAVDAKTGKLLWSTYSGAPDFPGEGIWPDFPKDPAPGSNAALARNTRRFEARPGLACFGNRVQIPREDGVLDLLDVTNGQVRGQYNALHASSDLGYQV